jgi:hypothetical protein
MSRTSRSWFWAALASSLCCAPACQRQSAGETDKPPSTSASGSELDGMQLSSARRVALESATAAMQRGDLPRLKQLSLWVRHRAKVSILDPDDLKSLDLAIDCLEQVGVSKETLASLEQVKAGVLKQPARSLCLARSGQVE